MVKEVHALGEHFAVFRGSKTPFTIHVTDLYCPHLGASLGSGGKVKGDCITCPFHNWTFDGNTGECVEIPYAKKVSCIYCKQKYFTCTDFVLISISKFKYTQN